MATAPQPAQSTYTPRSTIDLPPFIYGTAWKDEETANLVHAGLDNGFRALDTAAQPRHYREDLVGQGIEDYLSQDHEGVQVRREDLWIQTKFTPLDGHDHDARLPYTATSSLPSQIRSSVLSSLSHLSFPANDPSPLPYIDCLLLHSPLSTLSSTLLAWRTLESFVPDRIHHLGISNVNLNNLELMYDLTNTKPAVVQNRWYANPADPYDGALRSFCVEKGIVYQAFGVLSENPALLGSEVVGEVARKVGMSREAALYCLLLELGNVVVLNGTSNVERMRSDWAEYKRCRLWGEEHEVTWQDAVARLKALIGEDGS
ncbi:MAG: hypothetical protein LQ348_000306 [Seirophora lacunosa]|nr:MAG: hypothetical protein LQ348_000306 [Seirophora lacunosa]